MKYILLIHCEIDMGSVLNGQLRSLKGFVRQPSKLDFSLSHWEVPKLGIMLLSLPRLIMWQKQNLLFLIRSRLDSRKLDIQHSLYHTDRKSNWKKEVYILVIAKAAFDWIFLVFFKVGFERWSCEVKSMRNKLAVYQM